MLSDQTRCQAIGKEKIINNLYIYICLKASLNIIGSICSPPAETLLEIIAFAKIPKILRIEYKVKSSCNIVCRQNWRWADNDHELDIEVIRV